MCWTDLIPPVKYKRRLVQIQLPVSLLLIHPLLPSIFVPHQCNVVSVSDSGHSHLATSAS